MKGLNILLSIYPNRTVTMIQCENASDIYEAVSTLEKYLVPSYAQRNIDIDEYASKLKNFGKVWALKNEKGLYVGVIAAYMNDIHSKMAYLTMLAIAPEYRGLHLAEKLLQQAEYEAQKSGMSRFKLEVRKGNSSAIAFYKKHGYVILSDASEESFYMMKDL